MIALAALLLLAGQSAAESASDLLLPKPVTRPAVLPSRTPVVLAVSDGIDSGKARQGDSFRLHVARDVLLGDRIVIPKGTPAQGRVVWREGKGGWGKAAALGFAIDWILLDGHEVPVSGNFRAAGKGEGAAKFAGLVGVFVTGKSAVIPAGQEYVVVTRDPLVLAPR